jgi:membrane-associated phospholipid phosphatase
MSCTHKTFIWLAIACMLLGASFAADVPVGEWLYARHWHDASTHLAKGTLWAATLKSPGNFVTTIILAAALVVVARLSWRRGVVLLACGAVAILNDPMKWVFGRPRPVEAKQLTAVFQFDFFRDGPLGWLHTSGLAFPSGHTMLAFATATCLARYYPKWAWLCFTVATAVGVERVLEMAHHPSDVVAAAVIGVLLSQLCMWLLRKWAEPASGPRGFEVTPLNRDEESKSA